MVLFHILERGEKFFILDISGRMYSVSLDRLKPAYIDSNELLVTMPRKRGRPKKVLTNRFVVAFLGGGGSSVAALCDVIVIDCVV